MSIAEKAIDICCGLSYMRRFIPTYLRIVAKANILLHHLAPPHYGIL